MYTVEIEIRDQFNAIAKTIDRVLSEKEEICGLMKKAGSLIVLGCGSSFSLAKSMATQVYQYSGIPSFPLAAGDLLVNFEDYEKMLKDAAGSTSEAVRATARCRKEFGCPVISICAREGAPIEAEADVNIRIPWAFDEAVCQTRTVSNLYVAGLLTAALMAEKEDIIKAVQKIPEAGEEFTGTVEALAKEFGEMDWNKAVVLADSAAAGLAEEGALAFKEICHRDSNHYHLLDVRHGPIVQIDKNTLVVAMVSRGDLKLQSDLIKDVAEHTDCLLVCTSLAEDVGSGVRNLHFPDCGADVVNAVFMLYCIQFITLYHAIHRNIDPDKPEGLDAWIKL